MIPAVLGTAAAATGYAMKQRRNSNKLIANSLLGFGITHAVRGMIDLMEHRNE